jgi:hypothetical protein
LVVDYCSGRGCKSTLQVDTGDGGVTMCANLRGLNTRIDEEAVTRPAPQRTTRAPEANALRAGGERAR